MSRGKHCFKHALNLVLLVALLLQPRFTRHLADAHHMWRLHNEVGIRVIVAWGDVAGGVEEVILS